MLNRISSASALLEESLIGLRAAVRLLCVVGIAIAGLAVFSVMTSDNPQQSLFFDVADVRLSDVQRLLVLAIPLWLCSVAFSGPSHVRWFNLGIESQLSVAGCTFSWLLLGVPALSDTAPLAVVFVGCACVSAILWTSLVVCLKAIWAIDEVVLTLAMNAITFAGINQLLAFSGFRNPNAMGRESLRIPSIGGGLPVWVYGTLAAMVILVAYHLIVWWHRAGLRIRAVGWFGESPSPIGGSPQRTRFVVALVGAIPAAVAGCGLVVLNGKFEPDKMVGYGLDGITVALLGQHRILGIVLSGLFLACATLLRARLQRDQVLPFEAIQLIQSFVVLAFLVLDRRQR